MQIFFSLIFAFVCSSFLWSSENEVPQSFGEMEQKFIDNAQEAGSIMFNPPEGWRLADPKVLPSSVKIMVVGQGSSDFPPSINLGVENFSGTLKDYLKTIKSINEAEGSEWKDLGTIRTHAGTASLSQVDAKTEWGEVRMMHVIFLHEKVAYILTAASLKDEFSKFYKEFFKSMRSLRFNKNVLEMVGSNERRQKLKKERDLLQDGWNKICSENHNDESSEKFLIVKEIFFGANFQEKYWNPFKKMIISDFKDMGQAWQKQMLNQAQNELLGKIKISEPERAKL